MFFWLKLVLIILLNKTSAQDTQIIFLPTWNSTGANNIPLTLKVFGQLIELNLRRTDRIVSPVFDVWPYNTKSVTEKWLQSKTSKPCFYVHEGRVSYAIINFCQKDGLEGLIFFENKILEIKPLRNNLMSLSSTDDSCVRKQVNHSFGQPHLIERSQQYFSNYNFHYLDNFKLQRRHKRSTQKKLVVKLAVFVDLAAYYTFVPFLDNNEEQLRDMILAYVSRIQAAFHYPTFGVPLDILLVRLDIMKEELVFPRIHGNSSELLRIFCLYTQNLNSPDNDNPHHWDIGLYMTGTDLYDMNNGQKDNYLGLSYENVVCDTSYSCAMVEFGINNDIALGFASSLVAVHEIAHVLGIPGDDETIYCPTNEHIMAHSKYYRNQITWSDCSSDVAKELWRTKTCLLDYTNQENHEELLGHLRYDDLPGRKWTAKAQCELYLLDKSANVVTLHDICQTLQCETPKRDKYFFVGPALDGTYCALRKECRGGDCVPVLEPPYIFRYCKKDNWGEWKKDSCNSSCLENSKGVIIKRRSCMHRGYKTTNCEKPYYAIDLCDDSNICKSRTTIKEYTTTKCTDFSLAEERHGGKMYKYLYEKEAGDWGFYQEDDPSEACVIYCKRKNYSYYHSSKEILNFGIDPYFPDGTWCHNENGQDYYCRQHYCLPENYSDEE